MNKTVLVTGGSSGVGQSIVDHLSEEFHVITCARRLERMQRRFQDAENVHPYRLDLSRTDQIADRITTMDDNHGPILHVVNNAAVNFSGSIENLDPDDVATSVRINVVAPLLILKTLIPNMKEHDFGRIINVTSGAPLDCPTGAIPYSSSKAALNTATVTTAEELSEYNIKVNLMSPGPTESEMAPNAPLNPTACHPTVDYLLSLDEDGPSGEFFWLGNQVPLLPELGDVDWESGQPSKEMNEVVDQ
jgi:NAD(P)-dependent dehydrogenase (short-subunit alcohol dehydrogenase family)